MDTDKVALMGTDEEALVSGTDGLALLGGTDWH
ncbi:unnamed protein product [Staurois parvus]|uniref:Uncharacterized protein n=1 Tax=Staurois parvus TaxID=386267 RepID=A0ABN9BTS5_9NEOB|nr:unnamed protein product [Staurois parvus]